MRAIDTLILSDGRPGHYTLSEGIVAALARRRDVQDRRLQVRRPRWLPARALSSLVNSGVRPEHVLRRVYGLQPAELGNPDIIVSAGGDTLGANVAAARLTGASNLFYGSLRRYRPEDFTLVLTSYAEQATGANRLMTLKPSPLDPGAIEGPSAGLHRAPGTPPRIAGLIVGGNAGTVRYSRADWQGLLAFLSACFEAWGTRWIVSNAPRTPPSVSDLLAETAAEQGAISRFIDVRSAGPGTLGPLLAQSEAILCTGDSSTMLSECVWLRRRVVAVTPHDWALPANEASYRSWLASNGWTRQLPIADLQPERLLAALDAISPLADNPLERLAAELEPRLAVLSD